MTVSGHAPPGHAPEDAPTPLHWRQGLLALLPLAYAGVMPLWACVLLGGATLLTLRSDRWAAIRVPLYLLIVGLAALPELLGMMAGSAGAAYALALRYLLWLGLIVVLHVGTAAVQEGHRWGAVLVALGGLIAPQPGVLLALLGGLAGRPGPDDRSALRPTRPASRVWLPVAGGALLALALSFALPAPRPPFALPPTNTAPRVAPDAPVRPPAVRSPAPLPTSQAPGGGGPVGLPRFTFDAQRSAFALNLLAVSWLGMVVLTAALLLRSRQRGGRLRDIPQGAALLAALLLTTALTLLAALAIRTPLETGASESLPLGSLGETAQRMLKDLMSGNRRTQDVTALVDVVAWTAFVLNVLAALAVWQLLGRRRAAQAAREQSRHGPQAAPAAVPAPALHRIRLAYRQAEDALHAAGQPRTPAETPAGYAARLGTDFPDLQAPLQTLTRAYEPVRYGGHVSDEDADSAEAAAARITELAPALSVPEPKGTP